MDRPTTSPTRIPPDHLADPVTDHLHTETVTLREDQSVADAIADVRRRDLAERIAYLYVLGPDDRLTGVVPVRRLLGGEPEAKLRSVMISPVLTLPASSTVLEACETLLAERLLALPVVDERGGLRGVIDLGQFTDETITSTRRQMDSAFQLIGVHVAMGRRVSPFASFRDRFPWLLMNMASGIACALIASRFELLLGQVVVLAMFLTVVLALGESVSMQSMTITLQGLVGRGSTFPQLLRSARKEFVTSVLLGGSCGLLVAAVAYLWRGQLLTAAVIGASILLSIVCACSLGVLVPATIRRLRIDPKVAAGPIVLASADIATLLFYFHLSERLLLP